MEESTPFVVTISRQLGSGGSYIGQSIAKQWGMGYADREIIRQTTEKLSMHEHNVELRDESLLSFWNSFFHIESYSTEVHVPPEMNFPFDNELFEAESEIIKHIANERPSVIIGRCGFHILRKHPNCINIFLYADTDFRIKRIRKTFNVTETEAEKMILRNDKDRAAYCKTFTEKKWSNTQNYDLSIDTSKIGVENTIDLILKYIKLKEPHIK